MTKDTFWHNQPWGNFFTTRGLIRLNVGNVAALEAGDEITLLSHEGKLRRRVVEVVDHAKGFGALVEKEFHRLQELMPTLPNNALPNKEELVKWLKEHVGYKLGMDNIHGARLLVLAPA